MIEKFVKNSEQIDDLQVRAAYGNVVSILGIIGNSILFLTKIIIGILVNSVAIISDGVNNLSDVANCGLQMYAYKITGQPADKEHPFGHGRMESITTLMMALIICFVGLQLFKVSWDKIITPTPLIYRFDVLLILIFSLFIKLAIMLSNKRIGKKINNTAMLAVAQDAFNDLLSTSSTIIALIVSRYSNLPIDGLIGLIVSGLIIKSGFEILKDTIDVLLGKPISCEMVQGIKQICLANSEIHNVHGIVLHNYGPKRTWGTAHVELFSTVPLMHAHHIIDHIEKEIQAKYDIEVVIHLDPIDLNDPIMQKYYHLINLKCHEYNAQISCHDLSLKDNILYFDILIPYNVEIDRNSLTADLHSLFKDEKLELKIDYKMEF